MTNTLGLVAASYDLDEHIDSAIGTIQLLRSIEKTDKTVTTGYWTVSPEDAPEPFSETAAHDETFIVLSGSLKVSDDQGNEVVLGAGGSGSFDAGTVVTWTVLEPVVKFWVHS